MVAQLKAPGMIRGALMFLGGIVFAFFLTWVIRAASGHATFHHYISGDAITTGRPDRGPAGLPGRPRGLRLLVLLGVGPQDAPGGPLRSRRLHVEGLLPDQHRPQGDRGPVPGQLLHLPADRRSAGDADACPAGPARVALRQREHLQRAVLGARLAADLPVHGARVRGLRELRDPVDDRRPGHGLPAPERALLLAAADRRDHDAGELPGPRRRLRRRLDGLHAAVGYSARGAGVLLRRGPVRWAPPRS